MTKILIVLFMLLSSLYGVEMGKSGGCTLTQSSNVKIGYNATELKGVSYSMPSKSGSNFRELFVGATLSLLIPETKKILFVKVLDYKPNKRVKGKPKTGIFITEFAYDGKKRVLNMEYIFNKGDMKIYKSLDRETLQEFSLKEPMKIWFETEVAYSLCHVK